METWKALLQLSPALLLSIVAMACGGSPSNSPASLPALTIAASSLPAGQVNTAYSAALRASGGVSPYTWNIASGSLPSGLTISPTGTVSGTPTASGTSRFTLRVADAETTPQSATATLILTILSPLSSTTTALPDGFANQAYSATLTATGGLAPYGWTVVSGSLPAGLSLSAAGAITGMPSSGGVSSFTLRVADAETMPQSATAALIITILSPLSSTTTALPDGFANQAYSATLTATGGVAPYGWTVVSGSLPAGLSLSAAGAITGMPTLVGTSAFTLQVTDSAAAPQTATAQSSIRISLPLSVTPGLTSGIVNVPYSGQLAASGGVAPYSWSLVSGDLPSGLSLNAAGAITGTPTSPGTSNFTVKASDAESPAQQSTAQLSITIVAGLTITTNSLAVGTANVVYVDDLTAIAGIKPYTWSLASGALPPGLSLSAAGVISGVPAGSGTFTFTLQVMDSGLPVQRATAQLSIAIITSMQVTTQHDDSMRTGQDPVETILTPSNVNTGQFGKLFSQTVDGNVYAQPLYLANVNIPGKGTHNVIYAATEHDSVYAVDADSNSGQNANPLWQASFIDPAHGVTPVSPTDLDCDNIAPEIGITSTPVIDTATGTIYVLAKTKESGVFVQRLHALDIATGTEKFGGPTLIQASYPGNALDGSGGMLSFDPLTNNNRAGLLLRNGNVYVAWASHCDVPPYHGWVIAYDKTTLQQTAAWVPTPNGALGGIWMAGTGLSADLAGDLFVPIANGTFDTTGTPFDFGDSIVRLRQNGSQLAVQDYFTPYDQGSLESGDLDVGSGGALLLPDQSGSHVHELVQAGKGGELYVVDRDQMGHYSSVDNSQIVQDITGQIGIMLEAPAYWNHNVYLCSGTFYSLQAYSLTDGLLSTSPTSHSPTYLGFCTPVISSNGDNSGIVWALQNTHGYNGDHEILHAYDATNLANELYNSKQNQDRDDPGLLVKFAVPTVANGKVYVGSATQVSVYGLLDQH